MNNFVTPQVIPPRGPPVSGWGCDTVALVGIVVSFWLFTKTTWLTNASSGDEGEAETSPTRCYSDLDLPHHASPDQTLTDTAHNDIIEENQLMSFTPYFTPEVDLGGSSSRANPHNYLSEWKIILMGVYALCGTPAFMAAPFAIKDGGWMSILLLPLVFLCAFVSCCLLEFCLNEGYENYEDVGDVAYPRVGYKIMVGER
ncbi:hypothetical protein E3N88_38192 [Mikania micrantha]|uniref:Amino acid transporter transmembrane domain-containing protein n=1 Tax=Mikania micrantha TaxID=192012 RepID=A0A5N6LU25_9ASTR|nr:hypothetical protein E3N88_38192 [Mikania micrantha]